MATNTYQSLKEVEMNTLSIAILSVGLIITGTSDIKQNENIVQLSERIQILEVNK